MHNQERVTMLECIHCGLPIEDDEAIYIDGEGPLCEVCVDDYMGHQDE